LLNMLVYRRWSGTTEQVDMTCLPYEDSSSLFEYSPINPVYYVVPVLGEDTPLLCSHEKTLDSGRMSINGNSTD
jgi:hypothetical protein